MDEQQVEVLAEAISQDQGGTEVNDTDRSWARDLVKYLNENGWSIVRTDLYYFDTKTLAEDGPIQRALGMTGRNDGI